MFTPCVKRDVTYVDVCCAALASGHILVEYVHKCSIKESMQPAQSAGRQHTWVAKFGKSLCVGLACRKLSKVSQPNITQWNSRFVGGGRGGTWDLGPEKSSMVLFAGGR